MVRRVKPGAYCMYCKRLLKPAHHKSGLAFTKDHLFPQSRGGGKWFPCCRACNTVKADLTPEEWDEFKAAHPQWWKLYPRTARDLDGARVLDPKTSDPKDPQTEAEAKARAKELREAGLHTAAAEYMRSWYFWNGSDK